MKDRVSQFLAAFWAAHQQKIFATAISLIAGMIGAISNQSMRAPATVEVPVIQEVIREVVKEVPQKLAPGDPKSYGMGWVDDQVQVQQAIAQMRPPLFADTPAGVVQDLPPAVFTWKFYASLPIRAPPITNQGQVGSCVGFGTTRAIERCLAAEIVTGHKSFDWIKFTEEVIYANSRVDIGGGGLSGDGSVGAWAAQAAVKEGNVPRDKYPTADLTTYSESRCRSWGATGVPAEIKVVGQKYLVASTSQIKSWIDGQKALANGYSIAVSSNVGFNNQNGSVGTRDSRGVIMPRGTWNHCMCIDGYYTDTDGTVYAHIVNNWGPSAHGGPVGWGEPGTDGFWTLATVADRMLKQGDSWTFSGVAGFPRKKLPDWYIRHHIPPFLEGNRAWLAYELHGPARRMDQSWRGD